MSASKDYPALPLSEFLRDVAAKSPTPGGGSVAAIVGALGAALGHMAIEYTAGKPQFAQHDARLREALAEFGRAGEMFTELAREDMAAYERYAASRKADETEKQRAVATAAAVPLEIVALAEAVLIRCDELKAMTNPYLLSDLQAAAILAGAAAEAAALNVRVNLRELADSHDAARLESQLASILERTARHRQAVVDYRP